MNFYTKKWKEYIYDNYYQNVCDKNYNVYHKRVFYTDEIEKIDILDGLIPADYQDTSKYLVFKNKEEYKNYLEKEEKIVYTEELVKQEFDKYYQAKKDYINAYPKLKEMFGNFEKIELLSYEEELKQYKQRIENYAKKLQEEMPKTLEKLNITEKNLIKNGALNLTDSYRVDYAKKELNRISSIDDIDYRIIALNQAPNKYEFLYRNLNITNEVNGFLTGYKNYLEQRTDKFDYELLKNAMFHDALIGEIEFTKENRQTNGYIVIYSGNNIKYTLNFYNVQIIDNNLVENRYISDYNYGNYEDYKYYLRLDNDEFFAEKIEVIKSNVYEVLVKYDRLSEEYCQNIKNLENKIDKRIINKIKNIFVIGEMLEEFDYKNNALTITISDYDSDKYSLLLENPQIKYYHNQIETTKKKATNILKSAKKGLKKALTNYDKKYTKYLKKAKKQNDSNIKKSIIDENTFKTHINLRIDEIDNLYEVGILALTSEKYGDIEVIIKCTNIEYLEESTMEESTNNNSSNNNQTNKEK